MCLIEGVGYCVEGVVVGVVVCVCVFIVWYSCVVFVNWVLVV